MWNIARAANRWETHRALLSRLRAALQAKSQRLAVLSLHKSKGLPPVAVCAVAAFSWSEGDAKGIVRHFSPRPKKPLVNKPIKHKDGDQSRRVEMVEAKQLPPKALLAKKVSRIVNKKLPWPCRSLVKSSAEATKAKPVRITNRKLPCPQKACE